MSDRKAQACEAIDRMEDQLRTVSREIFEHPEVKNEEVFASRLLASELKTAGFEVELGVAGLDTAIRAVHPAVSEGPTVAILGEYDALPEIDHACGHNLIAAGGLGAALAVGSIKAALPGRLIFFRNAGGRGRRRQGSDDRSQPVRRGGCGHDVPPFLSYHGGKRQPGHHRSKDRISRQAVACLWVSGKRHQRPRSPLSRRSMASTPCASISKTARAFMASSATVG